MVVVCFVHREYEQSRKEGKKAGFPCSALHPSYSSLLWKKKKIMMMMMAMGEKQNEEEEEEIEWFELRCVDLEELLFHAEIPDKNELLTINIICMKENRANLLRVNWLVKWNSNLHGMHLSVVK